jgi:hypothetical protein
MLKVSLLPARSVLIELHNTKPVSRYPSGQTPAVGPFMDDANAHALLGLNAEPVCTLPQRAYAVKKKFYPISGEQGKFMKECKLEDFLKVAMP